MKDQVKSKLKKIDNIWRNYIWSYKFCRNKVKIKSKIETNYFGSILGYFNDTFDILFDEKSPKSYSDHFSNSISLLQCIYVHQDLIEESLIIFKCSINKGDLKKDTNYSTNRDIRNEIIGHPIRRENMHGDLISSSIFAYDNDYQKIHYLQYHKKNNYKFEKKEFLISEIIERHLDFLNDYFDKILKELKKILNTFSKELDRVQNLIDEQSFPTVVNNVSLFFEKITRSDYIYDEKSLLEIYNRKDEHRRYQHLIDSFKSDLISSLEETKIYIFELFEPIKKIVEFKDEEPIFNEDGSINFITSDNDSNPNEEKDYGYTLGKIASKRDEMDFDFHMENLEHSCEGNEIVLNELNHMKQNISNDVEYYTAFKLICKELGED